MTDPITMQDVRLVAGEGRLDAATVLAACNAVLRGRAQADTVVVPREPTEAMLQGACAEHRPGRPMQETTPRAGREHDTRECPMFATRRRIWSAMIAATPGQAR